MHKSKAVTIFVKRLRAQVSAGTIAKSTLHKITGISRPSIDGFLNGKFTPSLDNAEKIANALGYTLSQFIEDKPSSVHTLDDCYKAIGKAIKK